MVRLRSLCLFHRLCSVPCIRILSRGPSSTHTRNLKPHTRRPSPLTLRQYLEDPTDPRRLPLDLAEQELTPRRARLLQHLLDSRGLFLLLVRCHRGPRRRWRGCGQGQVAEQVGGQLLGQGVRVGGAVAVAAAGGREKHGPADAAEGALRAAAGLLRSVVAHGGAGAGEVAEGVEGGGGGEVREGHGVDPAAEVGRGFRRWC